MNRVQIVSQKLTDKNMKTQSSYFCRHSFCRLILTALLLEPLAALHAAESEPKGQILAFPAAEGHGAFTRGGRGGRVVHVTTLNKRGPGSLAWAINEVKEPRTIVFDVSGVIDCNNEIAFTITPENDQVTIAGETSPHGVAVYNYRRFDMSGEEVILRFLRFRGTRIHTNNDPDCLLIRNATNVIVDHCSFAGACDETINTVRSEKITLQWCGIDASRKAEAHADFFENNGQWHNYGSLHTRSKHITIHHCLYVHQSKRCPLTDAVSDVEAINNVIYNYSNTQQTWGAEGAGLTIVNCLFKLGPDRRKNAVPVKPNAAVIRGCVSREADMRPGPPAPDQGPEPKLSLSRIDTAEEAYTRVLQQAGALPHDATSTFMVTDTRGGTGKQGYEDRIGADRDVLEKATPVLPDSDQDGLPDEWERTHQLNRSDASDASRLTPDGYTELERYCHQLAASRIEAAIQSR
jgi:pectate lyase